MDFDSSLLYSKINIHSLLFNMSNEEFEKFIALDEYGNENPNKEYILNLLEMISSECGFEEKEKIIYNKLINMNSNE